MRVLKFRVTKKHLDYKVAMEQSKMAKELYNQANFFARLIYFRKIEKENIDYSAVEKYGIKDWFYSEKNLGHKYAFEDIRHKIVTKNDIKLNAKISQNVLSNLATNWKRFFTLKKNDNLKRTTRIPNYRKDYGLVIYNKQTLSIKALREGYVRPSGWKFGFKLPNGIENTITSARLYHSHLDVFVLEVLYDEKQNEKVIGNTIASIDLGINILATLTFDSIKKPICYKANSLKKYNMEYIKEVDRLKSKLPKNIYTSNKIARVTDKRNNRVYNLLHEICNRIIIDLCDANVTKLLVGWNKGIKNKLNLGANLNRKFMLIPHRKFINILKYKCESFGIELIEQDESYTSKSSFLSNDSIPTYNNNENNTQTVFNGVRISRGQFRDVSGNIIHADVNASYNILRKSGLSSNLENTRNHINNVWLSNTNTVCPLGKKI